MKEIYRSRQAKTRRQKAANPIINYLVNRLGILGGVTK